jgi:hypothetical protein
MNEQKHFRNNPKGARHKIINQVWWYMPIISALKTLRQEDYSLGYTASSRPMWTS